MLSNQIISHVYHWIKIHNTIAESALCFFFIAGIIRPFTIVYSVFLLPSTLFHELTHYIMALLFNGKPVRFSIIPKKQGAYINLGSVSCANITAYNAIQIGLSPFILVPAMILYVDIIDKIHFSRSIASLSLEGYMVFSFLSGCIPSYPDFKIVFVDGIITVLLLACCVAFYFYNTLH